MLSKNILTKLLCTSCVIQLGGVYAQTCSGTEVVHRFRKYTPDSDACRTTQYFVGEASCKGALDGVSVFAVIYILLTCSKYTCPVTLTPDSTFDTYMLLCPSACAATNQIAELQGYVVSDSETPASTTTTSENECIHECAMSTANGLSCTMEYHRPTSSCSLYTSCSGGICNMTSDGSSDYRTTRSMCMYPECDCNLLSVPTGVQITSCSTARPGNMVEYTCLDFYTEATPASTVCLEDGTWRGNPLTCNESLCTDPPSPGNGTVTSDGLTANYSCDEGFELQGAPSRTCYWSNGPLWNGTDSVCAPVQCPSTISVLNGNAVVNSVSINAEAYYFCDNGYIMNGTNTTVCLVTGSWSIGPLECVLNMCDPPTTPSNGLVSTPNGTVKGNMAVYSCDSGYLLSHSLALICNNSLMWSPDPPECIDEATLNLLNCPGQEVVHRFKGYAPDDESCLSTLTNTTLDDCMNKTHDITVFAVISTVTLDCQTYSCPVTLVASSLFDTYALTCSSECNTTSPIRELQGYIVSGSETATSTSISTENECIYDCAKFTTNGTSCTMSYHLPTSTCSLYTNCSGGICNITTSNNTDFRTKRAMCAYPECDCSLLNVSTGVEAPTCSFAVPGEMPQYNCSEYYVESSAASTICQDDGTWKEFPPTCDQSPCSDPPSPGNGTVSADGATANYTCLYGFRTQGPSSRDCHWSKGVGPKWTGTDTQCVPVQCPNDIDVPNGGAIVNFTSIDSEAIYFCDDGYTMNGINTTQCLVSGNWSVGPPLCEPTVCVPPTDPIRGMVFTPNGTANGSIAEYTCETGYKLSHSTEVVCNDSFEWSPEPPVCIRESLPMLFIRSCQCYTTSQFANKTQEQIISELVADTAINTQLTSLALNKLKSSSDPRTSSKYIGTLAIVFMGVIFGILLTLDLISVWQKFDKFRNKKVNPALVDDHEFVNLVDENDHIS